MIMASKERAISIAEAAVRLGVSQRTIQRMIDTGELRAFRVLRSWRIRESEIERIMSGEDQEQRKDDD